MRDKSIQRRNLYKRDEGYSDRDALVLGEDFESVIGVGGLPEWTRQVEEVQYNICTLREKTKNLAALHSNLLRRPSLDDNPEEERQLAALTNEIKRSLERCQTLMLQIQRVATNGRERILNKNVMKSLAFSLQEVKNEFTSTCCAYTTSVSNIKKTSSFINDGGGGMEYDSDYGTFDESTSAQNRAWTQEQMLFLEDNTLLVEDRDRAVQNVLKSTIELNELFRGVAELVHDQGSVLDRIDFNVEHAAVKVEGGAQQLKKAEHHQRKSRHMICILGLSASIIMLLIILILSKT